jgi:hypothetical protein
MPDKLGRVVLRINGLLVRRLVGVGEAAFDIRPDTSTGGGEYSARRVLFSLAGQTCEFLFVAVGDSFVIGLDSSDPVIVQVRTIGESSITVLPFAASDPPSIRPCAVN